MSLDAAQKDSPVVSSVEQLVQWLARAERGPGHRLVGLEHEKILYRKADGGPVPYAGPGGIGALFDGLTRFGWEPFKEGNTTIALTRGSATLSLEPGGQLELSGAPQPNARAAADENRQHLAELHTVAGELGLGAAALGYRPFGDVAHQHWMPKKRYEVMRRSLAERGALAHQMMLMTATGQVSLDWANEADCAQSVTLAARAAPLMVALFANSPLAGGKPSGFLSWRSRVWTQVDAARTGYFPHAVDGAFSYRVYVDWALDAPLLFLRRDGQYLSPKISFRALMAKGFEGHTATESDWVDHLSTLFPEVRLKRVLEFRSADCCGPQLTAGLAASLRGLIYDPGARAAALELLPARPQAEHLVLHEAAARQGLAAEDRGRTLGQWAVELLAIAQQGLDRLGDGDSPLLTALQAVAASGRSPAVAVLEGPRDPLKTMEAASVWA